MEENRKIQYMAEYEKNKKQAEILNKEKRSVKKILIFWNPKIGFIFF